MSETGAKDQILEQKEYLLQFLLFTWILGSLCQEPVREQYIHFFFSIILQHQSAY